MADWSQYQDTPELPPDAAITGTQSGNDWSQFAELPAPTPPSTPQTSTAEAAGRGFANSASFGLGKWVNGMVGAALNKFGNETSDNDPVLSAIQASTPKTGQGFWADVTGSVEGQRAANEIAAKDHPVAYVAGAVAPAVIGGVGTATGKVASGALSGLGAQIGVGAGSGAVSGASEATNLKDAAKEGALGAVIGGSATGVIGGAAKLLNNYGAKGAISALNKAVEDAKPFEGEGSGDLTKLRKLYETPGNPLTKEQLLEAAERTRDAITRTTTLVEGDTIKEVPMTGLNPLITTHLTGDVIDVLSPTYRQIGTNLAASLPADLAGGAGGAFATHMLGGGGGLSTLGGTLGTAVGITATKAGRQFATDAAQRAAMGFAGSPLAQSTTSLAPFAIGGTSGLLGDYINNVWAGR